MVASASRAQIEAATQGIHMPRKQPMGPARKASFGEPPKFLNVVAGQRSRAGLRPPTFEEVGGPSSVSHRRHGKSGGVNDRSQFHAIPAVVKMRGAS